LLVRDGHATPFCSASWHLGSGQGWNLRVITTSRPFVRLKSHGSSESANNSTSIYGQRIFLNSQLETYVKSLTLAHGIQSLSNRYSINFFDRNRTCPKLLSDSGTHFIPKNPDQSPPIWPHRTPVYIPTIPRYIDSRLTRHP
jgi:hypothetical protein